MHIITASIGASLLSLFALNSMAEQTIDYQYDELGRLTFVKDNVNGNRDYDYDPAGNRTEVKTGTSQDALPKPAAPTGLGCWQAGPGAYSASWGAVSGAAYYRVRAEGRSSQTTTNTSIVFDGAQCDWVQACNAEDLCSNKSNF